jgi:transcriptional regulator with XRE-family HTH domain
VAARSAHTIRPNVDSGTDDDDNLSGGASTAVTSVASVTAVAPTRNGRAGATVARAARDERVPSDLNQIVSSIGPKLRELRLQQRLSMQQLADRADVSAAAIHKIERSGMVPTITTLLKLAGALDRPVSYFVEEDAEDSGPVVFTPAEARNSVFTSHRGIDLSGISGPYGRFFVAGALATVDPGADSGPNPMEHPGEELVFVLDGVLEFTVEDQSFRLQKGDAIHFRTDRRHQWSNPGSKDARAVWMALRPG